MTTIPDASPGAVLHDPAPVPAPLADFRPEPGVGTPLAVGAFAFSVLMLGIPNTGLIAPGAVTVFSAVAFGTGFVGLFVGGLLELRANNTFGGSFAVFYSAFLLTTAIMLRFYAAAMDPGDFADAFGTWLLLWFVFTTMLSWGAWHINMPAFLAFALLAVAYLVLGIANFASADTAATLSKIGGWVLIADGAVALYLSWALAVIPMVGEKLPLWPHPYGRA